MKEYFKIENKEENIYNNFISSKYVEGVLKKFYFSKLALAELIVTQDYLFHKKFERAERIIDSPILVLDVDSKKYIIDGHHRTYLNFWKKNKDICALVVEIAKDEEYNNYTIKVPEFANRVKLI